MNEKGQALVFGALTLFMLVCFAAFVFNVGKVSIERMRLQHAADNAAYSGAMVMADIASDVAWINDGLAYLYYNAMRYNVDVITYGTLAELKEHGQPIPGDNREQIGDRPSPAPSDDLVGVSDPVGKYNEAYERAAEWLPRIESWAARLAKIEYGLAAAGPLLIRKEIFRTVHETLGVDDPSAGGVQVALFPDFRLVPSGEGDFTLIVTRRPGGWRLENPERGFWIEVEIRSPTSWGVTSSDPNLPYFTVTRPDDSRYVIDTPNGIITLEYAPGFGWVAKGGEFSVTPGENGGYEISSSTGASGEFRRGPDGRIQEYRNGSWENLGSSETVTIDGTEVPVYETHVEVNGVRIGLNPLEISIGRIRIVPTPRDIRISGQVGPVRLSVEGESAVMNGLSTANATGQWNRWWRDRARHRLTRESDDTWTYELVWMGGYFQHETNGYRGGVLHAVHDNDPVWNGEGRYPEWLLRVEEGEWRGWFDATRGVAQPQTYHQTRPCWHPLDQTCPVHGTLCPGDGTERFADPARDGGWHEPDLGPPPTIRWVPCSTCAPPPGNDRWGLDNDGDGMTDVRKYLADLFDRTLAPPDPSRPSYTRVVPVPFEQMERVRAQWRQRSQPEEMLFPLPLVLADEFFMYGLNVGVWKRGEPEQILLPRVFPSPTWGLFATASAKGGVRDGVLRPDGYLYAFEFPEDRERWVQYSPSNLYEPDFEVKLVSTRDAIRTSDLDIAPWVDDSGGRFLMRGFLQTEWYDRYDDRNPTRQVNALLRRMMDKRGRRFDPDDAAYDESVLH